MISHEDDYPLRPIEVPFDTGSHTYELNHMLLKTTKKAHDNFIAYRVTVMKVANLAARMWKPKTWWHKYLWDRVDKRSEWAMVRCAHKRMPAGLMMAEGFPNMRNLKEEVKFLSRDHDYNLFKRMTDNIDELYKYGFRITLSLDQALLVNKWIDWQQIAAHRDLTQPRPEYVY